MEDDKGSMVDSEELRSHLSHPPYPFFQSSVPLPKTQHSFSFTEKAALI